MALKDRHREEILAIEDMHKAKVRAKQSELDMMRDQMQDRDAIAQTKEAHAKQRILQTEKNLVEKIESEYADILATKEKQLQIQNEARRQAEDRMLQIEAEASQLRIEMEHRHKAEVHQNLEEFESVVIDLKRQIEIGRTTESKKLEEIVRQELEFKFVSNENGLKEKIRNLENELRHQKTMTR